MANEHTQYQYKILLLFIRVTLILTIAGTLIRPLVVELPSTFTYLGVINSALTLFVYLALSKHWVTHKIAVPGVITVTFITIIPVMAISGGANSQFAILIPLVPLVGAMTGNQFQALYAAAFAFIIVVIFIAIGPDIADLTGDQYVSGKTLSRGIWIILAMFATTYFGIIFSRRHFELHNQLIKLANKDPLTSALNRRGFYDAYDTLSETAASHSQSLAVLMLDLDHFKSINDTYGHDIGDECLIAVSDILIQRADSQCAVGRFGGEEFIIALIGESATKAKQLAESIQTAIQNRQLTQHNINLTVSIGIAITHAPTSTDSAHWIKQADNALYQAKDAGRNCIIIAQ